MRRDNRTGDFGLFPSEHLLTEKKPIFSPVQSGVNRCDATCLYGKTELQQNTHTTWSEELTDIKQPWGDQQTQFFYDLTPERVLSVIEKSTGFRCSGRSFAHNSMENRVYELEIIREDQEEEARSRVSYENFLIAKFYRPGRWSREQILEEHNFIFRLLEEEIPAVAPQRFVDGKSLHEIEETGLYYTVFPKVGGRSPDELTPERVEQVGRLMARMHNVGQAQKVEHRLHINADSYGLSALRFLQDRKLIPFHLENQYEDLVQKICEQFNADYVNFELIQLHGDCHLGNLLWADQGPFWVDFDDSVVGPAIQDLWLMLPGRDHYAQQMLQALLKAYTTMRDFDYSSLKLIEGLRALRLIHFSGWIGRRWEDPIFKKYFPEYGDERYWQSQIRDLQEQLSLMGKDTWLIHR